MSSIPKISIVVPVYNVEKHLSFALNSIINQSYTNLEIILVDDGSTDSSGLICDKFKDIDKRIKVIHKTNGGLSSARNVGLSQATGDWLLYFDSDDFLDKEFVNILYQAAVDNSCDVAVCGFYKFKDIPKSLSSNNLCSFLVTSGSEALHELLLDKYSGLAAWGKLAKLNNWKDIIFEEGRNFEDFPVMWKLFYTDVRVVLLDLDLYGYRKGTDSITSFKNIDSCRQLYSSICRFIEVFPVYDNYIFPRFCFKVCLECIRAFEKIPFSNNSISRGEIKNLSQVIYSLYNTYYARIKFSNWIPKLYKSRFILFKYLPLLESKINSFLICLK